MRIDQFLLEAEIGSKKTIKKMIKKGQVLCDGRPVKDIGQAVDGLWFNITVNGQRVGADLGHQYWLVNKPSGYVSANKDKQFPTIIDCLPEYMQNQHLAISGRLDRDSIGLVLLTDNGQLHYLLQQDRFHIEKEYEVTVNGWLENQTIDNFCAGVIIDGDYKCKPAKLEILKQSKVESTAIVIITEGKRHQIKKMFLSQGLRVSRLNRVRIGPLFLTPDIDMGSSRQLNQIEIDALKLILKTYQRRTHNES